MRVLMPDPDLLLDELDAVIGVVISLPFGTGGWRVARKIYLQRMRVFEAPLS